MLTERYGHPDFKELLSDSGKFEPFPRIENRKEWENIVEETRQQWLALAGQLLDFSWPALKMENFLELKRTGNISVYLNPHFERRSILGTFVMAECIENKGRFLDQIINGIFVICEETSWMPPLTNTYLQKINTAECIPDAADHVVDLSSSETAALLVWIYYLLKTKLDSISIRIGQRIEREVRNRVLLPYLEHEDYWWMGFQEGVRVNNWNPWCNSNVLMCFLLLETEESVLGQGIKKIMRSLDSFIATYSSDGCCDEGPMYWGRSGGSLYDCLQLLDMASSHKINIYEEPLVKDIGRYLYRVHIHEDYYVCFADGDAKAGAEGDVVFGYGKAIGDERLMQLGASIPNPPVNLLNWFPIYRFLRGAFSEKERKAYGAKAPYARDSWMVAAQVMTAQENAESEKGLYLAAKGGHNLESHNHNDVGSFVVYADGKPVLIDLGTEEYTAKTFSPQRFELWYLQSAYHNLPTVGGVMQRDGKRFRAKDVRCIQTENRSQLQMDISEAYPEKAGIISWKRTCSLLRGESPVIEITDDYLLKEEADELYFSLMTLFRPEKTSTGEFILEYESGKYLIVTYDKSKFLMDYETIELLDKRLQSNWGDTVYRVLLKARRPGIENSVIQIRQSIL